MRPSGAPAVPLVVRREAAKARTCLAGAHGASLKIQVLPFQAAQFAGAGAGRRRQDGERAKPGPRVEVDGGEQHADLLRGERRGRVRGDGGWFGVGGWVDFKVVPFHGVAECLVKAQVDLADGARTKPACLAVLAAVLGQVVVQLLELEGSERADGVLAEAGADVVGEQLA